MHQLVPAIETSGLVKSLGANRALNGIYISVRQRTI
jgi:hypothetical protein